MRYELTVAAAGAKRPWETTDALSGWNTGGTTEVHKFTRKERYEMNLCLQCPYPECIDCFGMLEQMATIRRTRKKKGKQKCSNTKSTIPGKNGSNPAKAISEHPKPEQYSVWDLFPASTSGR